MQIFIKCWTAARKNITYYFYWNEYFGKINQTPVDRNGMTAKSRCNLDISINVFVDAGIESSDTLDTLRLKLAWQKV